MKKRRSKKVKLPNRFVIPYVSDFEFEGQILKTWGIESSYLFGSDSNHLLSLRCFNHRGGSDGMVIDFLFESAPQFMRDEYEKAKREWEERCF